MLDTIKANPTETEEFLKNLVSDFLKKTWYDPDYYFINTSKRIDLVIHTGKDAQTPVGVIIETKKPGNRNEMISRGNVNSKALQELLLYYLRERISNNNLEIKHLIVTNTIEWFVFDARQFEEHFSSNKKLVELFKDFEGGRLLAGNTATFYTQIAAPYIENNKKFLEYTYFSINDFEEIIRNSNKEEDNKLISLFKLLSPQHLLKLPFENDSNTLNQNFYAELLYIMGLTEEKEDGKKVIVRNKEGEQNEGSLIESTIFCLSDYISNKDKLFEVSLELVITWINRILFLKLLESQQVKYQKGRPDYAFLNADRIKNYSDLNNLFFKVLAVKTKNRPETIRKKYQNIPYLNSSLFDMTQAEKDYFSIANLPGETIDVFPSTVLKDPTGHKRKGTINTLQYIFEFLNAYDFSSEGAEEIQEENKSLINASVLGLIFEKINGYKDGSYFTPGFITTYICNKTIRQVVINKFNEVKGWKAESLDDLFNRIDDIKEANSIVNSITICDPAVGSGHFLVSALNEIIAIKSDLKILTNSKGRKLKGYSAEVVNDELMIFDENHDFFIYNFKNKESQDIQEAVFQEKKKIIENCLFGVDINPNSIKICRLRLWIELLKNAYYTAESEYTELETLPNIDINIKCGNSLISRFDLSIDLKNELSKMAYSVNDYKEAVSKYKNAINKEEKQDLISLIDRIKGNFTIEIKNNDPLVLSHKKLLTEFDFVKTEGILFEPTESEKKEKEKKINDLVLKIEQKEKEIFDKENGVIYENAFEWRFEFPEVLNEEGNFIGFDTIIGNPPYVQLQNNNGELAKLFQSLNYQSFTSSGDIYQLFYENGVNILKENGYLCFITSNKWMRSGYGELTRKYFSNNVQTLQLIDFAGQKIFDAANVDVNIILIKRNRKLIDTSVCIIKEKCLYNLTDYIRQSGTHVSFPKNGKSWVILSDIERRIKEKIEKIGKPLKCWDINIYRGILTGCNEAFIIDKTKRNELIKRDAKSAEIIRPILRCRDIKRYGYDFADKYVIATFPSKKYDINDYSAVRDYLLQYGKNKLEQTGGTGARKKTNNKWFETQDTIAYWDDFYKQKILWAETMRIHKSNIYDFPRFSFTKEKYFTDKTCFFAIGNNLLYILSYLNSSIGRYLCKRYVSILDNGGYLMQKSYLEDLPIPIASQSQEDFINDMCNKILSQNRNDLEKEINIYFYSIFSFTEDEINYIKNDIFDALLR
jgi:hypothetical protein